MLTRSDNELQLAKWRPKGLVRCPESRPGSPATLQATNILHIVEFVSVAAFRPMGCLHLERIARSGPWNGKEPRKRRRQRVHRKAAGKALNASAIMIKADVAGGFCRITARCRLDIDILPRHRTHGRLTEPGGRFRVEPYRHHPNLPENRASTSYCQMQSAQFSGPTATRRTDRTREPAVTRVCSCLVWNYSGSLFLPMRQLRTVRNMTIMRLDQKRVNQLKPRKKEYSVRDCEIHGFGVRVWPSGKKRYFIHFQRQQQRRWKTIGNADDMTLAEARKQTRAIVANATSGDGILTKLLGETLFETVAEHVFKRYRVLWKPRTWKVNRDYYRSHILPRFGGRPIGDITRRDVQEWVGSLHQTPSVADRAAPVLSVIMREAEARGYRPEDSNPCKGIKRYRRRSRDRFLSEQEIRRLAHALARYEAQYPLQTALIRMLLLTGCRRDEIRLLRWVDYRDGKLFLSDSKTGPRTVWLSSVARQLLDGLPRTAKWVFPGKGNRHPLKSLQWYWNRIRTEADLLDVHLHDLRHTYASVALADGVTIPSSVVCSDITIRQPRSNIRTLEILRCAPPRKRSPKWWEGIGDGATDATDRCGHPEAPAPGPRVYGMGHADCRIRGQGEKFGLPKLCLSLERRVPVPQDDVWFDSADEGRGGAGAMHEGEGGATGQHHRNGRGLDATVL